VGATHNIFLKPTVDDPNSDIRVVHAETAVHIKFIEETEDRLNIMST
jgi:hypothetical protein